MDIKTEAEFKQALSSPTPVLVDFWAPWCAPCKAMTPALNQISQDYAGKVNVVKVDVDELPDLANKYQVRSVPTLFVIQSGQVKKQLIGGQSYAKLKAALDSP